MGKPKLKPFLDLEWYQQALRAGVQTAEIPLRNSELCAVVDIADYPRAMERVWYLREWGGHRYAVTTVTDGHMRLHRWILNPEKHEVVDHIDGDGLNNRRSNIRRCSTAENLHNMKAHRDRHLSKFKGIRRWGAHWWGAQISVGGKRLLIGPFDSEEEAARAYDENASRLFGAFARLNFPEEKF